ncbi:hypothetical protein IE53DRAFT_308337 [Violaceomyces palustris]|uniref:Uncharacterized protein n=1 Tax=Violaceomyces palustris TaxID=1673888 RepID=A0ACD0P8V3_9BASI|nr:hypothetical protein IE53DRAFT_308337 [Violaceomyces palustris]
MKINLGSFNIRFSSSPSFLAAKLKLEALKAKVGQVARRGEALPESSIPSQHWGEKEWEMRRSHIADTVIFNDWDIFAFQEVIDHQYKDLADLLGPEYDHVGVGRNDGKEDGEAVPVFWKNEKFERVNQKQGGIGEDGVEHFWLSPTPEVVGSVGWDAVLTRMCTHVSLRSIETGEILHVFSTHYDHMGVLAREKSSELLVKRAREAVRSTNAWISLPAQSLSEAEPLVILIGDLNSPRNEKGWKTLVAGHYSLPESEIPSRDRDNTTFLDTAMSLRTRMRNIYLDYNEPKEDRLIATGVKATNDPAPGLCLGQWPSDSGGGKPCLGLMTNPWGPKRTFTDFQPSPRTAVEDRIDFILLLDNGAIKDETRSDTRVRVDDLLTPLALDPSRVGAAKEAGVGRKRGVIERPSQDADRAGSEEEKRWRIRTHGVIPNWSEGDAGFLVSDHRAVMTRIERVV